MSRRTLLAIDTSTQGCSVAIYRHGQIIERFDVIPRQHLQSVLLFVDELLAEAELSLSQLDAITFTVGPGSFTGLRIGASVTQGLAYAADLPVVPISTLATMAQGIYRVYQHPAILVGLDAHVTQFYVGTYFVEKHGIVSAVVPDQLVSPADFVLPSTNYSWLCAGDGWSTYEDQLPGALFHHAELIDEVIYPHAQDLFPLALQKCEAGEVVSAVDAVPQYLQEYVVD